MQTENISRFSIILIMFAILATGCVRRRLTVRTQPANAMVYVDRQLVGPSPAATPFTYYGTRHIEIVGDGFRTEKILRNFTPPWYQIPPLDFITETLWPWEIRDERVVDVMLVPEPMVASEQLIERADALRLQTAQGIATPVPTTQAGQSWPNTGSGAFVLPPSPSDVAPTSVDGPTLPPSLSSPENLLPPAEPTWRPGQLLREFFQPGGAPVQRIPEVGGLQGGGYRPDLGPPSDSSSQ